MHGAFQQPGSRPRSRQAEFTASEHDNPEASSALPWKMCPNYIMDGLLGENGR